MNTNPLIDTVNRATAPVRGFWVKVNPDPEKALSLWRAQPSDRLPTTWGEMGSQRPQEPRRGRVDPWTLLGPALALALCFASLLAFALLVIATLWPYAVKGGFR